MVSVKGVKTANSIAYRRVSVSIEALRHNDMLGETENEVVEQLVGRGPDMFLLPAEATKRAQASEDAVNAGLSQENVGQLESVLSRRWNAFRIALPGDPPARVEPLRVTLKPMPAPVPPSRSLGSPLAWRR